METANHEYYVSLEVAKLLKEAGFKWLINTTYRDGVLLCQGNLLCDNFNGKQYENAVRHEFFSAPTLDVAQRWLREVKNYEIFVIVKFLADKEYIARVETNISGYSTDIYKFYEEAQEAGIKKALELILEKGE